MNVVSVVLYLSPILLCCSCMAAAAPIDTVNVCPKPAGVGTCVELCSSDEGCKLGEKCCSNGCGHECTTIQNCADIQCDEPICDYVSGVVVPPAPGSCRPSCGCDIGDGKWVRFGESYPVGNGCHTCFCTERPYCIIQGC